MKLMKFVVGIVLLVMNVGCESPTNDWWVTTRINMTKISVGMTEVEASKIMEFNPDYVSQIGNVKIVRYNQYDRSFIDSTPLYIKYVNGVVVSFGLLGDFDSTKDPTNKVIIDKTDKITMDSVTKFDLATELAKLDKLKKDGLITAEDYEVLKKRAIEKAKE